MHQILAAVHDLRNDDYEDCDPIDLCRSKVGDCITRMVVVSILMSPFLCFIDAFQILCIDKIRIVLYISLSVHPSVVIPYKLLSYTLKCPMPFIFAATLPCHRVL